MQGHVKYETTNTDPGIRINVEVVGRTLSITPRMDHTSNSIFGCDGVMKLQRNARL